MKRPLALLFFALVLIMCPAYLKAASTIADPDPPSLADAINRLNTSVQNLERLLLDQSQALEQQLAINKLNTAIAYLNFRSRKIELLERDLDRSRSTMERMEDFLVQVEKRQEQLADEARNSSGEALQAIRKNQGEVEDQKKLLTQRKERLGCEILNLEIKITDLQNQIDDVEAFVQENLDL